MIFELLVLQGFLQLSVYLFPNEMPNSHQQPGFLQQLSTKLQGMGNGCFVSDNLQVHKMVNIFNISHYLRVAFLCDLVCIKNVCNNSNK